MEHAPSRARTRDFLLAAAIALLALAQAACPAATRPADPTAPRAEEPPYPVVFTPGAERREKALANWAALISGDPRPAGVPPPVLRPVTATVAELPPLAAEGLRLPVVFMEGERAGERPPTDEELRESLRRFTTSAAPLLGVGPRELSLVEVADAPGGLKRAVYEQKPFAFPLRNGYGVIAITFAPDLRVAAMSSTALPDAEEARRALNAITPRLSAEDAVAALAGKTIPYTDAAGAAQTRTVTTAEGAAARTLVVYPVLVGAAPGRLDLHLAWEVAAGGPGSPLLVYVDAVTGRILDSQAAPS